MSNIVMMATTLRPKTSQTGQKIVVEPVKQTDVNQIRAVSTFFVDAFWKDYKAQALLTNDQKRRLGNEQFDDMRTRYGVGSPVPSSLIVARDEESGEILGCVGIEMALISKQNKIMPKTRENLSQNYDMRPLLANLAVSPAARKRGLARKLCVASEYMVKNSWGVSELLLLVEEDNQPAVKLYKRLGFKELWKDPEAKASMAVPYQNSVALKTVRVTNVGMRKDLNKPQGLLGLGFFGL